MDAPFNGFDRETLRSILQEAANTTSDYVTAATAYQDPSPDRIKMVQGILWSRRYIWTYNAVLLGVLMCFTLWHWAEHLLRARRRRSRARQKGLLRVDNSNQDIHDTGDDPKRSYGINEVEQDSTASSSSNSDSGRNAAAAGQQETRSFNQQVDGAGHYPVLAHASTGQYPDHQQGATIEPHKHYGPLILRPQRILSLLQGAYAHRVDIRFRRPCRTDVRGQSPCSLPLRSQESTYQAPHRILLRSSQYFPPPSRRTHLSLRPLPYSRHADRLVHPRASTRRDLLGPPSQAHHLDRLPCLLHLRDSLPEQRRKLPPALLRTLPSNPRHPSNRGSLSPVLPPLEHTPIHRHRPPHLPPRPPDLPPHAQNPHPPRRPFGPPRRQHCPRERELANPTARKLPP
ncbi:hypothetical protein M8818_007756 [Zalaria obscura]|uniref:Uncharacterized protein n=1 Tax=Zalaria obscura TaxID=2024903 RepID=A0ACC3S331_9PEZI